MSVDDVDLGHDDIQSQHGCVEQTVLHDCVKTDEESDELKNHGDTG